MPIDTDSLLSEIAQRYFIDGETQDAIGRAMGLNRMKVNRLLKQAQDSGLVEIRIRLPNSRIQSLEQRMVAQFGLQRVLLAPDAPGPARQRSLVAMAASEYLEANLQPGSIVAVGMGRNIAAVADTQVRRMIDTARFVCATGGAAEAGATGNADHICRRLAERFGGTAETLYAPAFVPDPEVRAAFLANPTVQKTFALAMQSDFALVGVGDLGEDSHMARMGWFDAAELAEARMSGIVGDLMGYDFFSGSGQPMNDRLGGRVIGLSIDQLRRIPCVIAVASERSKVPAIIGALRTGSIDVLATSVSICHDVLAATETAPPSDGP